MVNPPGGELAEYLLHSVTLLETGLDVVQRESFQMRNIILNECHSNFLPVEKKGQKPYLQAGKLTLGTIEGLSPSRPTRSRRFSTCDYPPIRRAQTRLSLCRGRAKTPGTWGAIRGGGGWIREDVRDECHILDLYNLPFLNAFLVFAAGRCTLGVCGGKTERVEWVTPGGHLRVGRIFVLLEITVGVIAIILGALGVIEAL